MLRLLDQANQGGRIAGNPGQSQLVALEAALGDIGVVREDVREDYEDEHACRSLVVAARERPLGRGRGIDGRVACRDCRGAALENATRKLVLASLEMAGNDGGGGDGSCCDQASGGQGCEQNPARPMNVENAGYIFLPTPYAGALP